MEISQPGKKADMYQKEARCSLSPAFREGKPINDGDFMDQKQALMGIMGRMATYTGQLVTWDGLMKSKEKVGARPLRVLASMPRGTGRYAGEKRSWREVKMGLAAHKGERRGVSPAGLSDVTGGLGEVTGGLTPRPLA